MRWRMWIVILIVGLTISIVSLVFLPSGWLVSSQGGPVHYRTDIYASYQYNTLKNPTGLLVLPDNLGWTHLYVADSGNHQIRRFRIGSGPLVVVSGTGAPGYVNGSTSQAQFNYPTGLSGTAGIYAWQDFYTGQIRTGTYHNVFIGDTQNYVVRKLCANVGAGPYPPCQTVQTACGSHTKGMVDGSSASACFASLAGLSVYNGTEYYMADAENHSIREWDGSNVSTYAGDGYPGFVDGYRTSARFTVPGKTTSDSSGNMYVADIGNNAVRKIAADGYVSTPAGAGPMDPGYADGAGSAAKFSRPTAVVFNASDGMTYIADSHNNCIRRMDGSGNVTTYAGSTEPGLVNGSLAEARFRMPTDLVIVNGVMYISDSANNVIRRINMASGVVSTYLS